MQKYVLEAKNIVKRFPGVKALSWNPQVMVLDEPTNALSRADVDKLFQIVKKNEGKWEKHYFCNS